MKSIVVILLITFGSAVVVAQDGIYELGPDSQRQPGVPRGEVTQLRWETGGQVYRTYWRDWWIYVPAQYDGETPAALMVFQDGANYLDETLKVRAPIVFDNLIHAGEMPVTIGIFVEPGRRDGDGGADRLR